jgi:DnaJ-domain-containing protein 1
MPLPTDLEPTASGKLIKTPFPHLLVYMFDRQLDGSIFFTAGDGTEHVVTFTRGAPSKVMITYETSHLGRVLLELGLLDQASLDRSLERFAQHGGLHGQLMISMGVIDRAKLIAGLREQVMRRMVKLFEKLDADTSYAFYGGMNLLESYGGPELTPVDPLRVLCRGVRARPDHPHVDPTLARLGTAPLLFHPSASDLGRFGFSKEELSVIDLMRARPSSLPELFGSGMLAERSLKVLAYVLLITRNIDLGKRDQLPVGIGQNVPQPPTPAATGDDVPSSRRPAQLARVKLKSISYVQGPVQDFPADASRASGSGVRDPRASVPAPAILSSEAPATPRVAPSPGASAVPAARSTAPVSSAAKTAPSAQAAPISSRAPISARPATATSAAATARPTAAPAKAPPPALSKPPPTAVSRPPPPAVSKPPVAGSGQDGKHASMRETIKARVEVIDKENFFVVLGLAEDSPPDALQTAYFALAKQWHPDRLPAELADVKELAAKCFARMSEAFQTLSDSERRSQYMAALNNNTASADEQAQVQQVLEAAMDYQKAEVFLRKRDLAEAEAHSKRAFTNDPEQPEYAALWAWITVLMREKSGSKDYADPLRVLTTAIDREPACERAYHYRALVLQKQNKPGEAIRDFRKALELNPRNIEAAREVRISDMRGGQPASSPPGSGAKGKGGRQSDSKSTGGLLGKLFKR